MSGSQCLYQMSYWPSHLCIFSWLCVNSVVIFTSYLKSIKDIFGESCPSSSSDSRKYTIFGGKKSSFIIAFHPSSSLPPSPNKAFLIVEDYFAFLEMLSYSTEATVKNKQTTKKPHNLDVWSKWQKFIFWPFWRQEVPDQDSFSFSF